MADALSYIPCETFALTHGFVKQAIVSPQKVKTQLNNILLLRCLNNSTTCLIVVQNKKLLNKVSVKNYYVNCTQGCKKLRKMSCIPSEIKYR